MLLNIPHPVTYIVEGCIISDIVHQQNAHSTPVVCCIQQQYVGLCAANIWGELGAGCVRTTSDSAKALLPSCVPYLQLNPFIVQHNFLDLEVNPT